MGGASEHRFAVLDTYGAMVLLVGVQELGTGCSSMGYTCF
jgi:hypothetical protein